MVALSPLIILSLFSFFFPMMQPREPQDDDAEFFYALDFFPDHDGDDDLDLYFEVLSDSSPPPLEESDSAPASTPSPPPGLRRRIRQSPPSPSPPPPAPGDSSLLSPAERRRKVRLALKGQQLDTGSPSSSVLTSDLTEAGGQADVPTEASLESEDGNLAHANGVETVDDGPLPPQSSLENAAEFVIKVVFFQINLLFSFIKLPFRVLHLSFLIIYDPFGTLYLATAATKARFLGTFNHLLDKVVPLVFGRVIDQQEAGKLVAKLACGFFWSLYVSFILFWILVASFLGGGLIMRRAVEEPIQMTEELSFDYTKSSPEALVSIPSYDSYLVSRDKPARNDVWRLVPPNQKLLATISLTLPESDYNRNLGVFQVRMELLTLDGTVTSSSSQPCLLRFKSPHIRLLETLLKSMLLLAGYSSESQVISVRMRGLIEGTKPTVCIRVALEHRAEYRPSAGIPEIYSATMIIESELPLLKRMIWIWKRTLFIWTSMLLFIMQLLILLVCCRPVILPRTRLHGGSTRAT